MSDMSDARDYFRDHAIAAVRKARSLPPGTAKRKQRTVARVCHLLSKPSAVFGLRHIDELRASRQRDRHVTRLV